MFFPWIDEVPARDDKLLLVDLHTRMVGCPYGHCITSLNVLPKKQRYCLNPVYVSQHLCFKLPTWRSHRTSPVDLLFVSSINGHISSCIHQSPTDTCCSRVESSCVVFGKWQILSVSTSVEVLWCCSRVESTCLVFGKWQILSVNTSAEVLWCCSRVESFCLVFGKWRIVSQYFCWSFLMLFKGRKFLSCIREVTDSVSEYFCWSFVVFFNLPFLIWSVTYFLVPLSRIAFTEIYTVCIGSMYYLIALQYWKFTLWTPRLSYCAVWQVGFEEYAIYILRAEVT
jgi:hypothetical protein